MAWNKETKRDNAVKALVKKMKDASGFTLSETLVAVLILVMISATALPAALKAYQNAVDAANAQVLLSTAVDALRSELSTAWDVSVDDGKKITYKSSDTGAESVISVADHEIMLQEYYRDTDEGWWDGESDTTTTSPRPLVPDATRKTTGNGEKKMVVEYESVSYSGEFVTITGLTVQRDGNSLASMPVDLKIRVMTKKDNPTGGGG